MARRATYINTIRKDVADQHPLLLFAGGYEFGRKSMGRKDKASMEALKASYEMMQYDLGLITDFEIHEFKDNGLIPPEQWIFAAEPRYVLIEKQGVRIGVILFPELPEGVKEPPIKIVKEIGRIVEDRRNETDILVGISSWGLWVEQAYLQTKTAIPDLLLGSGPGVEVAGAILNNGKVFWARSAAKGKSVTRIDLTDLPRNNTQFVWAENSNIHFESPALTDSYIEDINVLSVTAGTGVE